MLFIWPASFCARGPLLRGLASTIVKLGAAGHKPGSGARTKLHLVSHHSALRYGTSTRSNSFAQKQPPNPSPTHRALHPPSPSFINPTAPSSECTSSAKAERHPPILLTAFILARDPRRPPPVSHPHSFIQSSEEPHHFFNTTSPSAEASRF